MNENIFVIGHKNPDTDSICSAISYARFKQAQGEKNVIAARAGSINRQTEFILNYLKVPDPMFISDVIPKVDQAMTHEVIAHHKDNSLQGILQVMEEKNIRLVPIIDENRIYCGMVSLFDIAHEFRKEASPVNCREIFTSIKHIQIALNGELLCANNPEELFQGIFIVGAMQEESFKNVLKTVDAKNCLVITGDRLEIQKAAIESEVRGLIITGGLSTNKEMPHLAAQNKVNLLLSPYDTATTVGLVRLSTPAFKILQNYDGFLTIDEHLDEVRRKVLNAYNRGLAVLDDKNHLVGIITMADLLKFPKAKLILVDHNEISQAVNGAEQAEILEIIDHHRLGNPGTMTPILFMNQPVGSTCTLVAKLYFEQKVDLDSKTASLLLAGIISDTINLKSPTATTLDKLMIENLKNIAGLDLESFASNLLAAGVDLSGRSPKEMLLNDFKEYSEGKINFGLGQLEVVGFEEFEKIKNTLIKEIKKIREKKGYHFAGLMITDISSSHSLMIFDGEPILCHSIGYPIVEPHVAELKGVLSRKKQLLPQLLNVFKEIKI